MTVIVLEVGDSSTDVLHDTPPNTTNTPGNNWDSANDAASLIRASNAIMAGGVGDFAWVDVGTTDCSVTVTFNCQSQSATSAEIYLYARGSSGTTVNNNKYGLRVSPNRATTARLLEITGVTENDLDSQTSTTALSNSADITCTLTVNGTAVTAFIDDGTNTITFTGDDSTHTTGNFIGVKMQNTVITVDDITVDDLAAGGSIDSPAAALIGL